MMEHRSVPELLVAAHRGEGCDRIAERDQALVSHAGCERHVFASATPTLKKRSG